MHRPPAIAVLDQISQGRVYAGFMRGIQERWLNAFGQPISPALVDNVIDLNAHMQARAEIFDESIAIIRRAFTAETFSFKQNESIPQARLMRSLELMATKAWPNFTDTIGKPRPTRG